MPKEVAPPPPPPRPKRYLMIGGELSYYSAKVRSYLRYKGIPFDEVLATSDVYQQFIIPRTGVSFIPVLVTPEDHVIQDSADIIDYLEAHHVQPVVYPSHPRQRLVSHLFELFADEWLLLPAMHYRWDFPEQRSYIYYEFGRTAFPDADPGAFERLGEQMGTRFARKLPALGISDATKQAIEQSYLEFLHYFNEHLKRYPFLLGPRPCLGDFALMGPLYAHLYRDPVPGLLMKTKAPYVADWVERMSGLLLSRTMKHFFDAPLRRIVRVIENLVTNFLPDDEIPATLQPILALMFRDQFPEVLDVARLLREFAKTHPVDQPIPRSIGSHPFQICGVSGTRLVLPFSVWKLQRVLSNLAIPGSVDRQRQEAFLSQFPNALEYLRSYDYPRVIRKNNLLYFDVQAVNKL